VICRPARRERSRKINPARDSRRQCRFIDQEQRVNELAGGACDALPPPALDAVYRRMWSVLSGAETDPRYARLTPADRTAVVEILRDTKQGLPDYFRPPS